MGHIEIEAIVIVVILAAMQAFGKLPKFQNGPLMDFVKTNFDKLLLFVVFVGCMLYVRRSISFGVDDAFINWAQGVTGQVLAALLTLMVGNRLGQQKSPDPPPAEPKAEDAGK